MDILNEIERRARDPLLQGESRIYKLEFSNSIDGTYFGVPLITTYEGRNKYQVYLLIRNHIMNNTTSPIDKVDIFPNSEELNEMIKKCNNSSNQPWDVHEQKDLPECIVDNLIDTNDIDLMFYVMQVKPQHLVFV